MTDTSGQEQVHHSSLKELLEQVSSKRFISAGAPEDRGLAEVLPFPFLAVVGQPSMKTALLLAAVNPAVGGVLLVGPRGTGKTTAVRGLSDLLPEVQRSTCPYGCLPEDVEYGGVDAVCPECAKKYGEGQPLTAADAVRLIELPLNARLEDVIGGIDERAAVHARLRLNRGILSHADQNMLYIDEVNLLANDIVDAILDAAAQGQYTVRRGPVTATYRSRFVLIGSMNPEEGKLRPQIMDRFGLRVTVGGLENRAERLEAYRRVRAYLTSPHATLAQYAEETLAARQEISAARERLPKVRLADDAVETGIQLIDRLRLDSLRSDIVLFEAARAHAAADGRDLAVQSDVTAVAPMALRMRRSTFMEDYFRAQATEDTEIARLLGEIRSTAA